MKTKHSTHQLPKETTLHKKNISYNQKQQRSISYSIVCGIVILGIIAYMLGRNKVSITPTPSPTSDTSSLVDISPKTTTIFLTRTGWTPAAITIQTGVTVSWVNESFEDASLEANPTDMNPLLNLGIFSRGDTISFTFSKPGDYNYINKLHPEEMGTIHVE